MRMKTRDIDVTTIYANCFNNKLCILKKYITAVSAVICKTLMLSNFTFVNCNTETQHQYKKPQFVIEEEKTRHTSINTST